MTQEEIKKRIGVLEKLVAENNEDLVIEDDKDQIKILKSGNAKAEAEIAKLKAELKADEPAPAAAPKAKAARKPRAKKPPMSEEAKAAFVEKMAAARKSKYDGKTFKVTGKGKKPIGSKVGFQKMTMPERIAATTKAPAAVLAKGKDVMIKCQFTAVKNETDQPQIINVLGDEMVAYPGDWIMYRSEDGCAFTILAESTFTRRCIPLSMGDGDKVEIVVKKADGTKAKAKRTGTKAKTAKTPAERTANSELKKVAEKQVKKMESEGCDLKEFFANVQGSPISRYLFHEAHDFNDGNTDYRIMRVIVTADGSFYVGKRRDTLDGRADRFIGKLVGQKEKLTWYKVCGTRGTETNISYDEIKGKRSLPTFEDEKLNAAMLKKIYDYPEKSFTDCQQLAGKYYTAIQKGEVDEYKRIGAKYRPQCLTSRWRGEYQRYNQEVTKLAKDYMTYHPRTDLRAARSKVIEYMKQSFVENGGNVNLKQVRNGWIDDLGDDRDNY